MAGVLQGITIIVSGAGGGIGRAASLVLAQAGANVVVSDVIEESGRATVNETEERLGGVGELRQGGFERRSRSQRAGGQAPSPPTGDSMGHLTMRVWSNVPAAVA